MDAGRRMSMAKGISGFGLFLFILGVAPHTSHAANWLVDVGPGGFITRTSKNPIDIGTHNVTLDAGDSVTWNWLDGSTPISTTSNPSCGTDTWDSGPRIPPSTFSTTIPVFTPPQVCNYHCTVHGSMTATITVELPSPTLTVATAGTGSGSVSSSPAGITCPTTCSATYATGAVVTLTATPAAGSTFTGWSGGGCSGTGTCSVTMNAPTTVTATFSLAASAAVYNTTGEFDADLIPDVVVASAAMGKIQLYNSSSGTSFSMTDPNLILGLASGSFNSNTDLFDDLATLDKLADGTTVLSIYYGNRSGSLPNLNGVGTPSKQLYVPKTGTTTPETITSLSAKDINGDGKSDLIITLAPSTPGGDPIPLILTGNGDGTFIGASAWPPAPPPVITSIVVAPAGATLSLKLGQTQQYTAVAYDGPNGTGNIISGVSFAWASGNTAVCNVNSTGLASPVSKGGPVNITASAGGVTGTAACTATK